MRSIHFEGCNKRFGPPEGMSDDECFTVHAAIVEDPTRVITAWLPSAEDLANLRSGKPIYLTCFGGMTPVCLFTLNDDGTAGKDDIFGDEETKWINDKRFLENYQLSGVYAREFRTEKDFITALENEIGS